MLLALRAKGSKEIEPSMVRNTGRKRDGVCIAGRTLGGKTEASASSVTRGAYLKNHLGFNFESNNSFGNFTKQLLRQEIDCVH